MAETRLQSGEAFTPRSKTAIRSFLFGLGSLLFGFGIVVLVLTPILPFAIDNVKFVDLVSLWLVCLLSVLLGLLALRMTRSPGWGLKAILRWQLEENRATLASRGLPPRDRDPGYVQERYSGWVAVISRMLGAFVAIILWSMFDAILLLLSSMTHLLDRGF
jgi:hypothetical protein